MRKVLLFLMAAVFIIFLGIGAKLFLIGEPVDGSTVICDVREDDHQVDIFVTTPASAIGFTDARLRQEGTTLYITFRKVLVSSLYDSGQKSIYIEKCDLTRIVLGGKVIWEK